MQIKTTLRYHLTPVNMAIIKKPTNSKPWRGCGGKGVLLFLPCGGNETGTAIVENSMEFPLKT